MLDIEQMNSEQISELINQIGYGHLGCIHEGKPHVISMQYYVKDGAIYFFTDRGTKSQDLTQNPAICLQIEEVGSTENWQNVTIAGRVERLQNQEFEQISQFIQTQNPTFSPVINRRLQDLLELENAIAIYQIRADKMTGSKTHAAEDRSPVS